MKVTSELIQFGIATLNDGFEWWQERKARGINTAPTSAEVLARVKGKIATSLAEGQAALDAYVVPTEGA